MSAEPQGCRFTKAMRLAHAREYDRVFAEGTRVRVEGLSIWGLRNGRSSSRLGLSVGRKYGGAVQRNRLKRLIRDAFRINWRLLPVPCDLVIAPRPGAGAPSLKKVEAAFCEALKKLEQTFAAG